MTPLFDDRLTLRDRAIWALHECGLTSVEIASIRASDLFLDRKRDALSVHLCGEAQAASQSHRLTTLRLCGIHRRSLERYLETLERQALRASSPIFPGRRAGKAMDWSRVCQVIRVVAALTEVAS